MTIRYDLKNIINLALKIAYAIIASSFVVKFIKSGDERYARDILIPFVFILVLCFIPSIVALEKKIHKKKVGKVSSFFVFMGFYTTFLFVIMIYFLATFANRHSTAINEAEFANLISEYNKKNTENKFNPNLFNSLFSHKPESSGILILHVMKNGDINTWLFNYYYLIENYHNEKILPRKPEDIKYIIVVNPDEYEYAGLYSDGKTKGYRLVSKIDSYKLENDEIRFFETIRDRGNLPLKYIPTSRDSVIRGGGGDIDHNRDIETLIGNIYK
jgi:hypothetical protein